MEFIFSGAIIARKTDDSIPSFILRHNAKQEYSMIRKFWASSMGYLLYAIISIAPAHATLMNATISDTSVFGYVSGSLTYDTSTTVSFSGWMFSDITAFEATIDNTSDIQHWGIADLVGIYDELMFAVNPDGEFRIATIPATQDNYSGARFINANNWELYMSANFSNGSVTDLSIERIVYTFPYEITAVDEPTTLALLSLGLAGLGFTRRRMKAYTDPADY